MISHPALDRMQLIATPLVETSAHALAKKAADSLPVTPLVGTEIDVGEVHRMSDVAGLGDASFPPGATDGIQPVAVDSVIAVNFKASVDDRLVWGQNTPAGMGTQSSGEVSTQYELVIRRRAHTGPDAGVWTTLVDPALSRLESLIGLTPAEIAARLVPVVSLLWDGDVQREDKLDPRRLLVNAEVPFLTAEVNFEADEALVRTGGGWPCCRVRRKPRWHTLDYRDVPVGERAPATKEFTESHSTLHWLGAPPPVVGPALLSPGGEPVARVSPSAPAQTPFARMSFDEPASIVDIVILWRAMHLNRSLVVTPFRGLEVLPERTLKLSSPNLTRILLNEPDGITHVLLRFEGPAVGFAAAAAVDWLELSQVRYRARAEVLNDLLDAQRCNQTNDSAASGGKRFAWMANHDYELSLRTRVTVKDERSGSLLKELQQKLFFVTKGLPGLNAVARIGEELEPYVESRYAPADVPLYQAEPVVLAFNERYDVFAALEHPPSAADPPERKQAHDLVLAIEKIGGGGTEWRISQTAPDWIVAHRTIPPPPSGPGRRPPYVIGVSVLDPIVREGTREAPSLDPLSVRFDAVLASPSSCGLSEPPARKSRTLSHDAVDPDDPDVTPRRWPAQTVLRASVRRKDAPFVERTPFEPGDEVGLTRVGGAAWTVTDGAIGPDSGATSRQLALFGEASWEHLTARVAIDPAGVEAGVAVAVGGFPLGSRALLALVDPAAGRLRLVARHGGVDAELASAELTVTEEVALVVTAHDDELHAQVGDVSVSAPKGDLRNGRMALAATGGAGFPALRVDGLELYRFELTTSRYADLVEHVGSFGGTAPVFLPSGNETHTIAELLAADPGLLTGEPLDKLERQARFDRWASALALPLRRRVERLELSRRLDDDRTDLILIESPEPLPLTEDVSLGVARLVADPIVVLTPVLTLSNGDHTAAIVVPMGFGAHRRRCRRQPIASGSTSTAPATGRARPTWPADSSRRRRWTSISERNEVSPRAHLGPQDDLSRPRQRTRRGRERQISAWLVASRSTTKDGEMTNQRKLPRINRKWWVAPAVLAAAAMTLATIAVASDDRVPTTKPLSGTYTLSPLDVRSRRCVGTDGIYVEASGTLAGRSTSSDPRFNGRFEAFIDRGFTNLTTGYGASRGHVTWFNASGKPTARASYREVISQASHATGIFFGHVFAVDGLPASEMFANYKVTFDSNLNAQAEYGGVGDSQTPAIVQSGGCGGDEQGDQAR